jgi:hypothetical protein
MTSEYLDYVKNYFMNIRSDLESTGRSAKTIKLKNILAALGYRRRSQLIVDEINIALDDLAHIPPFEVSHQELRRHTFSGDEMEGMV